MHKRKFWHPCDFDKNCSGMGETHKAHSVEEKPEEISHPSENVIPDGATQEDMEMFEEFARLFGNAPQPAVINYSKDRSKAGKARRK